MAGHQRTRKATTKPTGFINTSGAAALLGVSETFVSKLRANGKLPAIQTKNGFLYDTEEVDRLKTEREARKRHKEQESAEREASTLDRADLQRAQRWEAEDREREAQAHLARSLQEAEQRGVERGRRERDESPVSSSILANLDRRLAALKKPVERYAGTGDLLLCLTAFGLLLTGTAFATSPELRAKVARAVGVTRDSEKADLEKTLARLKEQIGSTGSTPGSLG
jgi:hypothetical protein